MIEFFEYVNAYSLAICIVLIILFVVFLFLVLWGIICIVDWVNSVNYIRCNYYNLENLVHELNSCQLSSKCCKGDKKNVK